MNIDNVLNQLNGVKKTGHNRWVCLCPVHNEKTPSMTIGFGRNADTIIMKCFGCGATAAQVMEAIPSLTWNDFLPDKIEPFKGDKNYISVPKQDILTALAWECLVAKSIVKRVLLNGSVSEAESKRLDMAANRIIKATNYAK